MNTTLANEARNWVEWHRLSPRDAVTEAVKSGIRATAEERAQVVRLLTDEEDAARAANNAAIAAQRAQWAQEAKEKAAREAEAKARREERAAQLAEAARLRGEIITAAKAAGRNDLWRRTTSRRAEAEEIGADYRRLPGADFAPHDEVAGAAEDAGDDVATLRAILAEIGGAR